MPAGTVSLNPDVQRQARAAQPCAQLPAAQERRQHARTRHQVGGLPIALTKKIRVSCNAAADLYGDVLNWTRGSWWFRAWSGRYEVCPGGVSRRPARLR
jgi:hypothetical protein